MPVTRDQPGAYAPPSAILGLVERHRSKGLPSPVNAEVLGRAGIPDSLINRTMQSLQVLDLITEEGNPTPVLEGIRMAPEGEYKQRLTEWLNGVYADALSFVDPATDDEVAIRDAFRAYNPVGQQARMVTLFIGLFTAAGVMPERQKTPKQPSRKGPIVIQAAQRLAARGYAPKARLAAAGTTAGGKVPQSGLPSALAGLMTSLPSEDAGWTQAQRDKFYNAFGVMLDFCFPIVEAGAEPANGNGD